MQGLISAEITPILITNHRNDYMLIVNKNTVIVNKKDICFPRGYLFIHVFYHSYYSQTCYIDDFYE